MGMPYKNEDDFVMGQKIKIILIIVMLLLAWAANAQVAETTTIYDRINQIRKEHGLEPFMPSSVLELKAERWLRKMHDKSDGLFHDASSREAELLTDCDDPVLCWMQSKPHRNILLSKDYTKIGIVLVEGDWCARLN